MPIGIYAHHSKIIFVELLGTWKTKDQQRNKNILRPSNYSWKCVIYTAIQNDNTKYKIICFERVKQWPINNRSSIIMHIFMPFLSVITGKSWYRRSGKFYCYVTQSEHKLKSYETKKSENKLFLFWMRLLRYEVVCLVLCQPFSNVLNKFANCFRQPVRIWNLRISNFKRQLRMLYEYILVDAWQKENIYLNKKKDCNSICPGYLCYDFFYFPFKSIHFLTSLNT